MTIRYVLALGAFVFLASPCGAKTIYLDKLDPSLDRWWNALDERCRGSSGEASDLACDERLEVDKIIKRKGCWNIYPATGPKDTSYWKCEFRARDIQR